MTFLVILFNLFDVILFGDLTIRRFVTVAFDDYFFAFFNFLWFWVLGFFFYFFCVVVGGAVVEYR